MGGHILENAQRLSCSLVGWNLKRIKETFGVKSYDCRLAVSVSTPIESMILE